MTMHPLPPQAYTKETLVKAYQWLQHQSDAIKEMATNPDTLVGLFLKAKLQGDSALERPSIQNFKNELKNLAGMMGEFEVVEAGPSPAPSQAPTPPPASSAAPHAASAASASAHAHSSAASQALAQAAAAYAAHASVAAPAAAPTTPSASAPHASAAPTAQNPHPSSAPSAPTASAARTRSMPELDTRSWLMIQEVKNQLNLSSEQEALRVLISVGHTKVKALMSEK